MRDETNGLPEAGEPIDFDQGPFITRGLRPAGQSLQYILYYLDFKEIAGKVEEYGARADGFIGSMMNHSRGTPGERRAADLNALVDEDLNLVYLW